LTALFCYHGVSAIGEAADKYANRDGWGYAYMLDAYVAVGALSASCVLLALAVVAIRDTGWWAIGSIATGALFPLAIGWYLYDREDDGAAFYLAVGTMMVACAVVAAATQAFGRRSDPAAEASSTGTRPGDIPTR
jgi:hypothetical protein